MYSLYLGGGCRMPSPQCMPRCEARSPTARNTRKAQRRFSIAFPHPSSVKPPPSHHAHSTRACLVSAPFPLCNIERPHAPHTRLMHPPALPTGRPTGPADALPHPERFKLHHFYALRTPHNCLISPSRRAGVTSAGQNTLPQSSTAGMTNTDAAGCCPCSSRREREGFPSQSTVRLPATVNSSTCAQPCVFPWPPEAQHVIAEDFHIPEVKHQQLNAQSCQHLYASRQTLCGKRGAALAAGACAGVAPGVLCLQGTSSKPT
jgi:hypothetical protein